MKKFFYVFILIFSFLLVACNEKSVDFNCHDVEVKVGESIALPIEGVKTNKLSYDLDNNYIELKDGNIIANSKGLVHVTAKSGNIEKTFNVYVYDEGINLFGENEVIIKQKQELKVIRCGIEEEDPIRWKSSNPDVATFTRGIVTGVDFGTATLTASFGDYEETFEIEVVRPVAEEIDISGRMTFEEGAIYTLNYTVYPEYSSDEIVIEYDNDNIQKIDEKSLKINVKGEYRIKVRAAGLDDVYEYVDINVVENEAPKFEFKTNYKDGINVNYYEFDDILKDITAYDNVDGDITDKIVYDTEEAMKYGERNIKITVTDNAGNTAEMVRKVNIVWPYHTKFIGHAGCYRGTANTEEAFMAAASYFHYQAIECDVRLTKDNVFVTSHDPSFVGTDGVTYTIANCTYDEIKDKVIKSTYGDGVTCTLERYLEICKEYGCEAIIELKWANGLIPTNLTKMPNLVELIKEKGMWDNTVILTDMLGSLQWFRKNGYNDIRLQYLVQSCESNDVLKACKADNIDLSTNVTYGGPNGDSWLEKYHDAGLEISTWTFSNTTDTGYAQVQEWIDKGVEYVTCDNHYMEKLNLK